MRVEGAVALVTGGASGLGRATAERLAGLGARVVVLDLPGSDGKAVAAGLGGEFAPADVTDPAPVEAAVRTATGLGPLRIVVNCAGIGPPARVVGKDGSADAAGRVHQGHPGQPGRHVQRDPAGRGRHGRAGAGRRRARGARQHRLRRGVRGADRPGGVLGVQGRHRRHDAADRPGAGPAGRSGWSPSRPACSRRRCWRRLPEEAKESLGRQVPHPNRLGGPASMRRWSSTSWRTRCSTARRSGSTARSGWPRGEGRARRPAPAARAAGTGRRAHPARSTAGTRCPS